MEGLLLFAKETEVDLTVVGPEAALAAGVVDAFRKENSEKVLAKDKKISEQYSTK